MALVIALPSIFETLSLVLNDSNREWYARINGVVSEEGYVFPQTVGLMIFGAALLFLSPNKSFRFTGISLALITLIIENLDFFIGHNLQPGHVYESDSAHNANNGHGVSVSSYTIVLFPVYRCERSGGFGWCDDLRFNVFGERYNLLQ